MRHATGGASSKGLEHLACMVRPKAACKVALSTTHVLRITVRTHSMDTTWRILHFSSNANARMPKKCPFLPIPMHACSSHAYEQVLGIDCGRRLDELSDVQLLGKFYAAWANEALKPYLDMSSSSWTANVHEMVRVIRRQYASTPGGSADTHIVVGGGAVNGGREGIRVGGSAGGGGDGGDGGSGGNG
eukprot:6186345-Pleurochrysis_carterae.AAC.1